MDGERGESGGGGEVQVNARQVAWGVGVGGGGGRIERILIIH